MGIVGDGVRHAAGGAWLLASRSIGFGLFGLALGVAAIALFWAVGRADANGPGMLARMLVILACPLAALAWAIGGYQHGLRSVVYGLARSGKTPLLDFLMARFAAHARQRGWLDDAGQMADAPRAIDHFLERSDALPAPQRWGAALLHAQLPLPQISARLRLARDDPARAGRSDLQLLQEEIAAHVDREWLTPSLEWAGLLLGAQLALYGLLWWLG